MLFSDAIQPLFDRAFSLACNKKKLGVTFSGLACCDLIVLFFRNLSLQAHKWLQLICYFLPFFLCSAILLALGVLLIRLYHDEIKQREVDYRQVIYYSWEAMSTAIHCSFPLTLCYFVLWIGFGLFFLLSRLPLIGEALATILAFVPLMLNMTFLALVIISLAQLFLMTPIIALNRLDRRVILEVLLKRLGESLFFNLLLALIAMMPLIIMSMLLILAWNLTHSFYLDPLYLESGFASYWFFQELGMSLPVIACLALPILFFFNFAAEAHVFFQKNR